MKKKLKELLKSQKKLTPHEIDLAILEFEGAIEEKYQIAKTRKSKHEESKLNCFLIENRKKWG